MAAENNAIRTNYIKTKTEIRNDSKCRLYEENDEMVNHIVNECSKLSQKKYNTKHVFCVLE